MKNAYRKIGNQVEIFVQSVEGIKTALVSIEDFKRVSAVPGTWCTNRNNRNGKYYVHTTYSVNGERKHIYMHRFVMRLEDISELHVDHLNHNSLDNTRENLKATSRRRNINRKQDFIKAEKIGDTWHVCKDNEVLHKCNDREEAQLVKLFCEVIHFPHVGEFRSFDLLFRKYDFDYSILSANLGGVGTC